MKGNWKKFLKGVVIVMASYFASGSGVNSSEIRKPAVSGSWYSQDPKQLQQDIKRYLDAAEISVISDRIIGIVVPHAGYVYSGPVAAYAYKALVGQVFDMVLLLGNAHHSGFIGAALDDSSQYLTPLGGVAVDLAMVQKLKSSENHVYVNKIPHISEHSLEAQLPFLQYVLKPGFKIVPVLFGYDAGKSYRYILDQAYTHLKDKKVLIVASSDLTHYPSYTESKRIDSSTLKAIASMDTAALDSWVHRESQKQIPNLDCILCGKTAVECAVELSKKLGADSGKILRCANSGDVPIGRKDEVVGYGSVAFIDKGQSSASSNLGLELQKKLLGISRNTLEEFTINGKVPKYRDSDPQLSEFRGAFVTLHSHDLLRGCIGYIEPQKDLLITIIENTVNASSRDPRFKPVQSSELNDIDIEISVLTVPVQVSSWEEIELGRHGVILKKSYNQAVFLPQVAPEQGWTLEETLRHLALKAGLRADDWKTGAEFWVFEAAVFGEKDLGRQTYHP